jgi:hypothetical protein
MLGLTVVNSRTGVDSLARSRSVLLAWAKRGWTCEPAASAKTLHLLVLVDPIDDSYQRRIQSAPPARWLPAWAFPASGAGREGPEFAGLRSQAEPGPYPFGEPPDSVVGLGRTAGSHLEGVLLVWEDVNPDVHARGAGGLAEPDAFPKQGFVAADLDVGGWQAAELGIQRTDHLGRWQARTVKLPRLPYPG